MLIQEIWRFLSVEARDFVTKLLVYDAEGRLDVKAALRHPWLTFADRLPPNQYNITTDTLRNYYNSLKWDNLISHLAIGKRWFCSLVECSRWIN